MPNKYSHGLVFYHQQHQGVIHTDPPLSLKSPSSRNPRSHTRSTAASTRSSSNHSTQSNVHSRYLRLEPDPEPEPSYSRRSSAYTSRLDFDSTPSDAPPLEPASSQRSRPPSDRLRLESPFGFRLESPPSPAPKIEPKISDRSQCEPIPSHRPDAESSPQGRLRLESPLRFYSRNPRPSLHHKSSSVETQIYAPEPTTSSSSTREGRDIISVETHEPYPSYQHRTSSTYTQEPQHVFSMDSPGSSPPPISTGNRQERSSSEFQGVYLPSPTRDRRQRFIRETQTLASPPCVQDRQAHSPFGTQETPLFPSARELQDYFSLATQGPQSAPSATGDRQNVSSLKAHSASPRPSQEAYVRPLCDMQQLQSSHRTKGHQRRRFLGTQDFSSERRPQISQESVNARRQSFDSQTTQDRQIPPSGPRRLSSDLSIQGIQRSRRASVDSKPAQEHRPHPSSSSQQLSLKQFIQESEYMWEPSNTSQIYSRESSSSHTADPKSRQTMSANAQEYIHESMRLEQSPRSRRDRPSKLPDTFASQHRILLPTSEGNYDNVMVETHGFPPERPPSPPETPDSGKRFSRLPQTEVSHKTRPPPIPPRSTRRSPPRQQSILSSTDSSVVYLPSEIPRPKTSSAIDPPTNLRKATALRSPTFSISTRRSSINATMSPQSVSFSDFSETMKSPRRVSFSQSRDREYFEDADLESLPPDIDFNVLPYENPNAGPAIFRATQLGLENPVSPRYEEPNIEPILSPATQPGIEKSISHGRPPVTSRSSSFDSAAPPPIGLNRRISYASAESYEFKAPKKESRMSLISFLRSTSAPKAVLYSEATQGKPPVPVSVSRTAVPSIPLLFPGYRGQFPPPQKTQDKGLKAGLEPRTRPGSDARTSGARSTAHLDAAEKRKSWFKGDDVDKGRGASRPAPANKWELERILSDM